METKKINMGLVVVLSSLFCFFLLMVTSEVKPTEKFPIYLWAAFTTPLIYSICSLLNIRQSPITYETARFLCEKKEDGTLHVAYKTKQGYRYALYHVEEEPTEFTYCSSTEFHKLFNTINRPNTPKVSAERMKRMELSD